MKVVLFLMLSIAVPGVDKPIESAVRYSKPFDSVEACKASVEDVKKIFEKLIVKGSHPGTYTIVDHDCREVNP